MTFSHPGNSATIKSFQLQTVTKATLLPQTAHFIRGFRRIGTPLVNTFVLHSQFLRAHLG